MNPESPRRIKCRSLKTATAVLLASLAIDAVAASPQLQRASDARITTVAANTAAAATPGELQLELVLPNGSRLALSLHPQTRLMQQAARHVTAVRDGNTSLYAGTIPGHPGSWVRMTRIGDAWLGAIHDGTHLWLLDPARDHVALATAIGAPTSATLVFSMDDVAGLPDAGDDARPVPHGASPAPLAERLQSALATTSTYTLGVSLVLDTEFQQFYGANAASTAVGMLNIVDGFYSAQVDTRITLHALQALAGNGAMTSTDADNLLDAFTDYGRAGNVSFNGVAHLLSGKDFDGNTAGLAWIGVLCNTYYGYGVDQMTYSAAASAAFLAHEIGHNYGANHDGDGNACPSSGYIMQSVTDIGSPPTQFSTCSLDYFAQYLVNHAHACLDTPDEVIFVNGFDPTTP